MKKLMNQNGSSMALTVCFTMALSIAGMTLLSMTNATVKNNSFSTQRTKAFWTCESGIEMGMAYLKKQTSVPSNPGTIISDANNIQLNGYLLNVSITKNISTGEFTVSSTAKDAQGNICAQHTQSNIAYDNYLTRVMSVWGYDSHVNYGWWGPWNVYGDVFMNMNFWTGTACITNGSASYVKFYGKVLVAGTTGYNYGQGVKGDYSTGVQLRYSSGGTPSNYNNVSLSGTPCKNLMDNNMFLGGFEHVESEVLPVGVDQLTTNLASPSVYQYNTAEFVHTGDVIYTDSTGIHTPYIQFNSNGTFEFFYKKKVGGSPSASYIATGAHAVDNTIIYSPYAVNVRGTVTGKATVATALNKDIIIDRDIVYSSNSFNAAASDPTQRVLSTGTDALGLVAGGDIFIVCNPQGFSQPGKINICGALFALGNNTYNPGGLNDVLGGVKCEKKNYKTQNINQINTYGSTTTRIAKKNMWSSTEGHPGGSDVYDSRFKTNILPPGMPYCVTADGYLKIQTAGIWQAS